MDAVPNSHECADGNAWEARKKFDHNSQMLTNPDNPFKGSILTNTRVFSEGFSIREYVGKVRNVNIRKSWPFSESLLDDCLREGRNQVLPPLHRPTYRWWASQHSLQTDGISIQRHGAQQEDNTEGIIVSEVDAAISKDLEEQIRKLSTVKISGSDDNTANREDGIRRRESKYERRYNNGHRHRSLAATSAPKFTSQSDGETKLPRVQEKGKADSDSNVDVATGKRNQNGKPGTATDKAPATERQVLNFTFDSTKEESRSFTDAGIGEETERPKKARKMARDQVSAGSNLTETDKNKIDNLNLEGTKSEPVNVFDISSNDVSGLKVCPVCKTFTSTTVTAVNAHMDDCLAQASNAQKKHGKIQRQKSRAQKKRSIVDICAAAPPVNSPLDSSENLAMDTSADSAKANCKLKKTMVLMDTGVESATTISCKRKRTIGAHSQEIGKTGRRKAETVETKRKRQRLRIISSLSKGVKALKKPSGAVRSKKTDNGVQQHPKPSIVTEETRDSNAEQQPSTEEKSVKKHQGKKQQQSSVLMDHAHAASMLSKKDKGKEGGVYKNNALGEESRTLPGEENRVQSLSNLTMAVATSDVSRSYEMKDTLTPQNQSSQSDYDKSDILGDNECRHHKAYGIDGSRLQLEETSKPQDPNLLRVSSKSSVHKNISPGENGKPEQFNVTCSESEFNVMHSLEKERSPVQLDISDQNQEPVKPRNEFVVITECKNDQQGNTKHNLGGISTSSCTEDIEWENENSKVQYSLKNEGLNWETRRATEENHIRNARLNLNKKMCFLPRDSKGRFLSSHGSNGGKAGDINSPPHKRKQSQKSTKSLKNFPKNYSMEKEINHGKAHLSENANGHGKFNIHGNFSGYSYRGFPLDSQGELLRYIPNTIPGFNQLNKIANYSAGNEPLTSEGTKAFQEFSFVESIKTFPAITPINQPLQRNSLNCLPQHNYSIQYQQPDCRQDYSVSKTNQSNLDERGSHYSSLLDQIQRDGSSNARSSGSSIGTPDAMSVLSMQAAIQFGYNEEQKEKTSSALVKSYPGLDISRRKQPTPQPVMRLMGQSFTIGRENEAGNAVNDPQQCNSKHSKSMPGATVRVSSPSQLVTHYNDHCTTCGKDKFYLQNPRSNALCQHCRGKANMSKSLPYNLKETQRQEMKCCESIATHKVGTSNHNPPNLIEKRLPTDYVFHGEPLRDRSYSSQAWISSPPVSAPGANMFISPVSYLCNNTCLNEGQKMAYKGSHVSNHGYPLQQQSYSQLLNSCLGQHTFQKQQQNDWKHTSNPYSHPIHSDSIQSLPCTFNSLGSLSGILKAVTCAPAHSTSFPTGTQIPCQAPSSSTSIADSPTSMLQGNGISSSINFAEQEKLLQKLPNNMARSRCETCCEKGGLMESINVDRMYGNIIRTREGVQETEGLHGKLISEKHEVCETGPMQRCDTFSIMKDLYKSKKTIHHQIGSSSVAVKPIKSRELSENNMLEVTHGQICRINNTWVDFAMDRRNSCDKKAENEPILKARPPTGLAKKCPQSESGTFSRPNNNFLEMGMRSSINGLHCSNAGFPLELAEPIKLSGGAKHILKPSSQNGNGQQSWPIHYTQPFGETTAEVRDRNLEAATAYK